MVITRWDPVRGVVAFQNPFNTLFRDLNEGEGTQTTASFIPAVDVYEDEKKVVLKLECRFRIEHTLEID